MQLQFEEPMQSFLHIAGFVEGGEQQVNLFSGSEKCSSKIRALPTHLLACSLPSVQF